MKKILSLLLIFTLCFTLFPVEASAAVKINKKSLSLIVGENTTLKILGTKDKIKWISSDENIVMVSSTGKVIALFNGSATITAIVNKKKYNCKITVTGPDDGKTLYDLVTYMYNSGVISGKSTTMYADIICALSGVKYEDSSVELYEYNTKSDIYKSFLETNSAKIDFNGIPIELNVSAVNGKFVIFCDDAVNKDEIIDVFNNFE
jgi:hypothetical protein